MKLVLTITDDYKQVLDDMCDAITTREDMATALLIDAINRRRDTVVEDLDEDVSYEDFTEELIRVYESTTDEILDTLPVNVYGDVSAFVGKIDEAHWKHAAAQKIALILAQLRYVLPYKDTAPVKGHELLRAANGPAASSTAKFISLLDEAGLMVRLRPAQLEKVRYLQKHWADLLYFRLRERADV